MDYKKTSDFVAAAWGQGSGDGLAQDVIEKYIAVPNASPDYDSEWATNGHQEAALRLLTDWVAKQNVQGLQMEVIHENGRTPLLFITVEAANGGSEAHPVLMYGHFDKQPPLTEDWDEGIGPYTPVVRDGKLYGRGGADDGYSTFAAILAVKSIQEQGQALPRIAIIIEGCEESGSPDLEHYVEALTPRLGDIRLIVCLDSGCGDFEHFWITNSLRGIAMGTLRVRVLDEAMHSGSASGIVPSSFRIARHLLDRIEDAETGEVKLASLHTAIPDQTKSDAAAVASVLGDVIWQEFPFAGSTRPVGSDNTERLLNKTWRPTLSVVGAGGIPAMAVAGNVLRVESQLKLSVRLPPGVDPDVAVNALKSELERDPPYGAIVAFEKPVGAPGWAAPPLQDNLATSIHNASKAVFGNPMLAIGEGGSIPFMGMLGKKFPRAQFVVTGVLGPKTNAHGPNEFLPIQMAKNVTTCVAHIVSEYKAS